MIKLKKGDKPSVLADNAKTWTDEISKLIEDGEEPTTYQMGRYNHPEIKAAVIEETSGKCAYCESKILHIDFGDIEHIIPKKSAPELRFEWDNLTLACSVCNNKKRDYHNDDLPLVDPYEDDPEVRLLFFGPLVRWAIGDANARMTERQLLLNREKLIERRTERMDNLRQQLEVWRVAPAGLKAVLAEDFKKELGSDREYSSMARSIAKAEGLL